jgi:hypothetical protein
MACTKCKAALPYLFGFPEVDGSVERMATIVRCPQCWTFYEIPGLAWTPPEEVDDAHLRRYYPDTWRKLQEEQGRET